MFKSLFKLFGFSRKPKVKGVEEILKSVETFNNRTIHKELTVDIIDQTPDENLLQVVFDNLSEKVTWDGDEYEKVSSFSKGRQAIFVIWCLEAEVINGGFNQYYFNSSGQFANLTPQALRLVEAPKYADLMERANKTYEEENKKITEKQDGSLEGFSKSYEDNPLNAFDDEYYDLEKNENLQQLQIQYIRNQKTEFTDK